MQLSTTRGFVSAILILSGMFVLLIIAAATAEADVLIDNLGTDATKYHTVYGPSAHWLNGETGGGISFSVTSDYYLNSISVIAKYVSGNSAAFDLALFDDNSGIPRSLIASRTVTPTTEGIGVYQSYSADFGSSVVLTAGTTYWAAVYTTGSTNDITLYLQRGPYDQNNSPILTSSQRAMYGNMKSNATDSATALPYWMHMWNPGIQVQGSPVPEPGSLLALSSGILSLFGAARRKIRRDA